MSNLQEFHHTEEAPDKTTRIAGWAVAALIVVLAGIYVAESGLFSASPAQAGHSQDYPRGL